MLDSFIPENARLWKLVAACGAMGSMKLRIHAQCLERIDPRRAERRNRTRHKADDEEDPSDAREADAVGRGDAEQQRREHPADRGRPGQAEREADQNQAHPFTDDRQTTTMLLAAHSIGHQVLLYDGSFEDWSRHKDYPVDGPAGRGRR
jgi:hypothetical protein